MNKAKKNAVTSAGEPLMEGFLSGISGFLQRTDHQGKREERTRSKGQGSLSWRDFFLGFQDFLNGLVTNEQSKEERKTRKNIIEVTEEKETVRSHRTISKREAKAFNRNANDNDARIRPMTKRGFGRLVYTTRYLPLLKRWVS
jgi:hypothetical protein